MQTHNLPLATFQVVGPHKRVLAEIRAESGGVAKLERRNGKRFSLWGYIATQDPDDRIVARAKDEAYRYALNFAPGSKVELKKT